MLLQHFLLEFKRRSSLTNRLAERNEYDKEGLIERIKGVFPNFNEQKLLTQLKTELPIIHYIASNDEISKAKKYCEDNLIKKIMLNKSDYRISKDIDNVRVEYARVEKFEDGIIKVYASVFFYDEVANNESQDDYYDKYWNDIWVISLVPNISNNKPILNKCPTCGASMKYNQSKHMFTCEYCRNSLYYAQLDWKILDIEVNEIDYKL